MKNRSFTISFFIALAFCFTTISCSVETLSSAGVFEKQQPSKLIASNSYLANSANNLDVSVQQSKYMASLTNVLNEIPLFKNKGVNKEVSRLKNTVKSYVYALKDNDSKQIENTYQDYIEVFKNLQNLKKDLNSDEEQLLDVYLTRIKANINSLEYLS